MSEPEAYPKAYLYQRIVAAKLFIDAHFAEPVDVDAISNEACYSKFHFIRVFHDMYGRTPRKHLTHCRVERAKALLSEGMPAVEACHAAGFSSISSFSRAFKSALGMPPAAYRKAALERQAKAREAPLTFIPDCFSGAHGWRAE